MNIKYFIVLIYAITTFGLVGCGRQAEADTPPKQHQPMAVTPTVHHNLLEDIDALKTAQASLSRQPQLNGKPILVFENINFFDGTRPRIELNVQDPLHPHKVLFYRYENKKWHYIDDEENTVGIRNINRHLTPLTKIHFEDVATIAQMWRHKANETHAVLKDPYHIAFILLPKTQKRFWHTAELEAQGAQYYLSINPDFSIFEFKRL